MKTDFSSVYALDISEKKVFEAKLLSYALFSKHGRNSFFSLEKRSSCVVWDSGNTDRNAIYSQFLRECIYFKLLKDLQN